MSCGRGWRRCRWRRAGLVADDVRMSVNVSGRQLDDPGSARRCVRGAIACGRPAREVLRLEITESTLMQEPERMRRSSRRSARTGVGLHLDDFGTGYSSLAALHSFPSTR